MNLYHLLRFLKFFNFFSANNLDGSQYTGWLKFGTFQGYYYIAELLVKIT